MVTHAYAWIVPICHRVGDDVAGEQYWTGKEPFLPYAAVSVSVKIASYFLQDLALTLDDMGLTQDDQLL